MSARETRGEEMVDRYANLVYRLAFARTRSRDAADEIFQEVFLRYVSRQPAFDSEAHAKAWFCRVTVNCANSYWRNPFRRRTAPLDAAAELSAPEPEEARLDGYLDKLPPELRAAVHLYYYEGYQTAEIAALTGLREGSVRSRLTRARTRLRQVLKGEDE